MLRRRAPRPYADPYLAGVGLGLVLLAAFVVMGRGLGASGAFASAASGAVAAVDSGAAQGSGYFAAYVAEGPWTAWLLFEVAGVFIGAFASAWWSGRVHVAIEGGPRLGLTSRAVAAFGGGAIMGLGAVLARGCTSGQTLTGGALLSAGSWTFMLATFASAFAVAPFARRLWR